MRNLFGNLVIVIGVATTISLGCAAEDRSVPWFEAALECSVMAPDAWVDNSRVWDDASPCAGESRDYRFLPADDGTVVFCDSRIQKAAVWQNRGIKRLTADKADAFCATFCNDPKEPDRCTEAMKALSWRLAGVDELDGLRLRRGGEECTIEGCRMDPVFQGECGYYWAAEIQDEKDPDSQRAFRDMRGGGSGWDTVEHNHYVRCVGDR